jgi:hypothetical protein
LGLLLPASAPAAGPEFGLKTFSNLTLDANDAPDTASGGHPDRSVTEFSIPLKELHPAEPVEVPNGAYIKPPVGFLGNPAAAPRCPFSKIPFSQGEGAEGAGSCPPGSQVGIAVVTLEIGGGGCTAPCAPGTTSHPLYNLPPERGYPAQFGFKILDTPATISVFQQPRTESYGLTVGTPNIPSVNMSAFKAILFGTPSLHGSGDVPVPFLSNPVDCSETEPKWSIAIDSTEHTGSLRELGVPDLFSPNWKIATFLAAPVTGCGDRLLAEQFDPAIATTPLQGSGPVLADQPSGLAVDLDFPQSNDPTDPSTTFDPSLPQAPEPRDVTIELPAGLSISPAAADGLGACSDQASDPAGDQVHYDNTKPVSCPDSSKIGSALATTPLLATRDPITEEPNGAEPINGSVYMLKPHPGDLLDGQDGRFRLLIQLENDRYGINLKLPGVLTADKETGQITMVFSENPQLPASHLRVTLKPGPRAPLMTPVTCGKFESTSTLVPWSTPGTPDAHPGAGFSISGEPDGTGCPLTPAPRPFTPALSAGPESNRAGQSSPFDLRLTREDGEGELSSFDVTTPAGFTATLKDVTVCPEAAIAAADGKRGAEEQAGPSCPPSSQVGLVTAGVGPGTNPYDVAGRVYLAGPYKDSPLSLVSIFPAVSGSFDLGTVVVRAAVDVDPETARITVRSDAFPRILDGVPLRLRSVDLRLDRPGFARNPTSCSPLAITATLASALGQSASLSRFFQVGDCAKLGFKPRLALHLPSGLSRNGHPALRAALSGDQGEAGIAAAIITLPAGELLDLHRLPELCAREPLTGRCPSKAMLGKARVWSPLFADPLEGPIYLRVPSGQLPDLSADLHGDGLHFVLQGQTSAPRGRLRISFSAIPDVPFSKAVLTLSGGRRGIVVNSQGLCGGSRHATVDLSAHNGKQKRLRPLLQLPDRC